MGPTRLDPRIERKGRRAVAKKLATLKLIDLVYVPVGSISPNPYNPNHQTADEFELLLRSIEEDGFTQPILVHRDSRQIVDGEHRWRAASVLGMTEVPVVFTEMTPEQMRIATLRHNRARGSEDVVLTAQLFRELREMGALDHAKDSLMIADADLKLLLENVAAPDLLADDEFTMAWEAQRSDADHMTAGSNTSLTDLGAATLRAREAALANAKTEQDRQQARAENRVYRLSLVLGGAEADVVRAVLGDHPAAALVTLCRDVAARNAAQHVGRNAEEEKVSP